MIKKLLNKGERKLEQNFSGGDQGGGSGRGGHSGANRGTAHGHGGMGTGAGTGTGAGMRAGTGAGAGAGMGAGAGAGLAAGAGAASMGHGGGYQQQQAPMSTSGAPSNFRPKITTIDLAGLPVHVYGLNNLSQPSHRGVPDVCISIHMHGRTGSSKNEEPLATELYNNTMSARQQLGQTVRVRDFLLVTFDSRNHGERKTNPQGQKSWKEGNPTHAIDMYGMIRGTADDLSFIAEMLPSYLFPNDERRVSLVSVTGKSLGGHSSWHVLAHNPTIRVGVSFIGTPDFQKLIAMRAKKSGLSDTPPTVPSGLRALMQRVDPAMQPYREVGPNNPFYGKKICACCGADDTLVRFSYSQEFLENVVVAPPGSEEARRSFQVYVQPDTGHKVTSEMLAIGGQWLAQWALPY